MKIESVFDKTRNLRTHIVSGTVTVEETLDRLNQIYADPRFDPDMNALWDFRNADLRRLSLPDVVKVRDFVEENLKITRPVKSAMVVNGVAADYSLSLMYETLMQGSPKTNRSFTDIDEARQWVEGAHTLQ